MTETPNELFLNREISLLQFNRRVLAQALDESVPLLERLRFLCIASSNLDEFFEIRVAGLKQMLKIGATQRTPDGMAPAELFAAISKEAHALVEEQYTAFNDVVMPALEQAGIRFLRRTAWLPQMDVWMRHFFLTELLPVLSPIGLDPAHPFPRLLNKSLNFIVSLSGKDAFGRAARLAVVQAPRALPRLIRVPAKVSGGANDFVFLSSVIHAYVDELFPGMEASGCYQFRVTRNSDLLVDEQDAEDLLEELEDVLEQRQWGDTVRLEIAHNCPGEMQQFLMEVLQLSEADIYRCNGPVNLMRLMSVPEMIERPDLKYPPFTQKVPKWSMGDLFAAIREKDRLLHHPYDSFMPVVELLRQAAKDPCVLAIKQTLYRTGAKSPIVDALVEAAHNGKEVTVVVELRARFDEADNIDLAERLQEVGAHVVYGVVGYKTHAKMMLIVRREIELTVPAGASSLKNYVHLGTGNYHPRTSRIYTDYGLMTADAEICRDVHTVFLQLTSLGKAAKMRRLLQSPFTMASGMHAKIDREIDAAKKGKSARIIAKMNSLVEPLMIQKLYAASQAGVKVDLIVRGMCCVRPGVKGVSDNIRVHSVIGRFLEHHRTLYFENGGESEIYLSSADWMERNLFKRVEISFPLLDAKIRAQVTEQLLAYVADTAQSWRLNADGSYERLSPAGGKGVQSKLLEALTVPDDPVVAAKNALSLMPLTTSGSRKKKK